MNLSRNYNIIKATSAKVALELLDSISLPDIIISDIIMDEMDGYEFYDGIIKKDNLREIPFIFLTVKNSRVEKIKALNMGAIDCISKPFLLDELTAKIETLLRYREAHTEGMTKRLHNILSDKLKGVDDKKIAITKKCKELGVVLFLLL